MRYILSTALTLVPFLATSSALADTRSNDVTKKVTEKAASNSAQLSVVGTSKRQWTGVAVAADRRVFVNYPRWSDNVPISVAQLLKDSSTLAFPDNLE